MFKKLNLKSILIGLILGVVLTSSVFADTQSIQVFFNDIKVSLDNIILEMKDAQGNSVQPLIYNGTTYLPARALCEALGKDISMDTSTNTLKITSTTTGKEENTLMSETVGTTTETTTTDTTYEENGLTIRELNGEKYVDAISFQEKYNPAGYKLVFYESLTYRLEKDEKILLERIQQYNGLNVKGFKRNYIKYENYINDIKPLIGE